MAKFRKISQVLNLGIPVLTNFCLFHMKYTNRSVMDLMLDVSKVLFFKLKQNDTSGGLLNLLCDFLKNRKQSSFKQTSFNVD